MESLQTLEKTTLKSKKRVGRGGGSGKGFHTVGRGAKGQKARGKMKAIFVGSKLRKSLVKRLPFLRGKGKQKSVQVKPTIIHLKDLSTLPAKSVVDLKTLAKLKLIKPNNLNQKVKILSDGDIKVALTVLVPCSVSAKNKIEKAGGTVSKN